MKMNISIALSRLKTTNFKAFVRFAILSSGDIVFSLSQDPSQIYVANVVQE